MWKPKSKIIESKLTPKETNGPSSEETRLEENSENPTGNDLASSKLADNQNTTHKEPNLGDRYEVLEFLGAGGMGSVWKVFDKELKEHFAVKVLLPALVADDASLKRFQKEAELASELNHPNIVAIYGAGSDVDGNPTIIMRLVQGESLEDVLKREGKLPEEQAIDIAQQICEALVYSHSKGIVHRDIKPSNIIISKTKSGADLVQLVDFGIARCVYEQKTATMAITKAVDMLGSPLYMSPEQLLGEEVTEASDIYSFGCVFYEMLTGKPPFYDENPVKVVLKHVSEEPDLKVIPERLRFTLECTLRKAKGSRFSARYHGDFLNQPDLTLITEMSLAVKDLTPYWHSFSLLMLFQASLNCLPMPTNLLLKTFLLLIFLALFLKNSIYRKSLLQDTRSDGFCWLLVTFSAMYFPIFFAECFWPPFVSIGYAMTWIVLMRWQLFQETLFARIRKVKPSKLSFRDPSLNHKEGSKMLTCLVCITWFFTAQCVAMIASAISNLAVFGFRYGVFPFSFARDFQDDFKYHLIAIFSGLILLTPLFNLFPKKKFFVFVGTIFFSFFTYQQLTDRGYFIGPKNADLARFFPSTQVKFLADVAKEPADKKRISELEKALGLLNKDPATANSRLIIANKILDQSKPNLFDGWMFANVVKLELDPSFQNNWPQASKIWDRTFNNVKSHSEYLRYETDSSLRKQIRAAEAELFDIALKNGDTTRAQSIVDRWKVIFGDRSIKVLDAQKKVDAAE